MERKARAGMPEGGRRGRFLRQRRTHPMNATTLAAPSLAARADALEAKMARQLDYIVVKSRLHALAEGDLGSPPSAAAQLKANPNARMMMGDDPRLPAMPEKPALVD